MLLPPLYFISQNPWFISPIQPNSPTFLRFYYTILSSSPSFWWLLVLFLGISQPRSLYSETSKVTFQLILNFDPKLAIPTAPPSLISIPHVSRSLFLTYGYYYSNTPSPIPTPIVTLDPPPFRRPQPALFDPYRGFSAQPYYLPSQHPCPTM